VTAETTGTATLIRNPLSLVGVWLTTLGAFAFLGYLGAETLGYSDSPYSGLIGFVAVPAVFLLGLVLIPLGMWREARRRRAGRGVWSWPAIDLGHRRTRFLVGVVGILTVVNATLIAVAGLGATHYMETTEFCGQVCHEPMKPEFSAHAVGSHSSVPCVACHVGPGAQGVVRAKMNGTRQLYKVLTGTYARPIPVPAHGLPTAQGTCEGCHTPGRAERDVIRIARTYAEDETNTETATEVVLYMARNHWHARKDIRVEYLATDPKLETIPYVRVTDAAGQVTEYFAPGTDARPAGDLRRMDCLDCHTRPAHAFSPTADAAVDLALASGQVPKSLPYVKREMVAALKQEYPDERAALDGIRRRLAEFYAKQPAQAADAERAITTAERLYRTNVFPSMKVTWGTYLSQMGHSQMTGCFRCHTDEHKSRDGRLIRQDCALCHKEM
jgi:hypothetical protein